MTARQVAVKQLKNDAIGNASLLIEEMHHLSSLDHPHVVKFLHYFQDDENLYLVTAHCAGGNVDSFTRRPPLDQAKGIRLGRP